MEFPKIDFRYVKEAFKEPINFWGMAGFAIGAAFFAHPASPAIPDDFNWRRQVGVFRTSLPEVLAWPLTLWRFWRNFGAL